MIRRTSLFLLGVTAGVVLAVTATQSQVFQVRALAKAAVTADTYKQLDLFGSVFERVRSDYVERPEDSKLIESAINGMLTSLDPHSSYMDAKAYGEMQTQTRGEFGGLGIEVSMEDGAVKVVAPIDETPAARAGIQAGDLITHLNDEPVQGLNLQQAVERMRGKEGTPITIRILRKGAEKPLEITLIRDRIQIRAVRWREEGTDKDIGYIRITSFTEKTSSTLKQAIDELAKKIASDRLKGYIVDLRNNPGGLLESAVEVSDTFLERGEIVSTRGRNSEETQRRNAHAGDLTRGKPLIVLINGGSASASEIVAGALQDHKRATILGSRSFGKGSVQTIIPVSNGAIRLTTARYFTPSGRSIQAKGIEPDIELIQDLPDEQKAKLLAAGATEPRGESGLRGHLKNGDGEKTGSPAFVPPDPKDDTQLKLAIDLLNGTQKSAAFPPNPKAGVPN